MRVDMKRIFAFLTVIVMALGLCACKGGYSSKISDVKSALEETCKAQKAETEQYDKMVDTKYKIEDVAEDFKDGVFAEIKSRNFTYFGFHTVVEHSTIKSVFKYLKTDPATKSGNSVGHMEVLVIQFTNGSHAQKYFDDIMAARKQAYKNNEELSGRTVEIKNQFIEKKEYFAFASQTEFTTYNVYASIDGSTVMYAFVEGPNSDTLLNEYYAFMKKMECSVITL